MLKFFPSLWFALLAMMSATGLQSSAAQSPSPSGNPASYRTICTIHFDKDARRPARVQDDALPCLQQAKQALSRDARAKLYFVATADKKKDNEAGHGEERTEQDMSGEDLRYADVAAYRAVNTKAYLIRWMAVDARRIVPLTTYEDGQWLTIYLVPDEVNFKSAYGKPTAPILSRPCTVAPCPSGPEEFLLAQPRTQIIK